MKAQKPHMCKRQCLTEMLGEAQPDVKRETPTSHSIAEPDSELRQVPVVLYIICVSQGLIGDPLQSHLH